MNLLSCIALLVSVVLCRPLRMISHGSRRCVTFLKPHTLSFGSFDDLDLGKSILGGDGDTPKLKNNEKCTIFVGNLPFETTDLDLIELAKNYGVPIDSILSARIATKFNTNRSRGFGYLEFASEHVAQNSLKIMEANGGDEGLRIADRTLKLDLDVGMDAPKGARTRTSRTSAEFSLFLGNLDFSLDNLIVENFVQEMIAERVVLQSNILKNREQMRINKIRNKGLDEFEMESDEDIRSQGKGNIASEGPNSELAEGLAALQTFLSTPVRVKVATDPATGRSKGFGKCFFSAESSRDFALEALQMTELNGRELTVAVTKREGAAHPPREHRERDKSSTSIFLGNLSFETTADDILSLLTDVLGPSRVTSIRLAAEPYTGKAKGFGHVDLKNAEDCERAVDMINGMTLLGRPIRVDYATNTKE